MPLIPESELLELSQCCREDVPEGLLALYASTSLPRLIAAYRELLVENAELQRQITRLIPASWTDSGASVPPAADRGER